MIKRYIIVPIIALLLLVSCKGWMDFAGDNQGGIDENTIFTTEGAFRNAVNGVYAELRTPNLYGGNMGLSGVELMGQQFVLSDTEWQPIADFNYVHAYSKIFTTQIWESAYSAIYNCNNTIEILNRRSDMTFNPHVRELLEGELIALRAMVQFDLLRLYHPPYASSKTYVALPYFQSTTQLATPMSSEAIVAKILEDINRAEKLLKENDPVATRVNIDEPRGSQGLFGLNIVYRPWRLNYNALLGLKARVLLYKGDAADAAQAAYSAIEGYTGGNAVWPTPPSYDIAFSTDHLFGLASPETGLCQLSQDMFVTKALKVNSRVTTWAAANPLDNRRKWLSSNSLSPKYGPNSGIGSGEINSLSSSKATWQRVPMIKISEMYLVVAEALANSDFAKAKQAMVTFKLNRGVNIANTISTPEQLLEMVEREYAIEFLGEAQYFYYLKRRNFATIDSYIAGETVEMNPEKYTLPIPQGGM